jgi:hypothetical protein
MERRYNIVYGDRCWVTKYDSRQLYGALMPENVWLEPEHEPGIAMQRLQGHDRGGGYKPSSILRQ